MKATYHSSMSYDTVHYPAREEIEAIDQSALTSGLVFFVSLGTEGACYEIYPHLYKVLVMK